MNTNIRRNLLIGFGISLLLLIITSVASYNSIGNLLQSNQSVSHTDSVILNLESLISTLKDAETGQRGFLLTGNDKFLEPYNGAYQRALNTLDEIKGLTIDNKVQNMTCEQLRKVITERLLLLDQLIKKRKESETVDISKLEDGKIYMDQARNIVHTMEDRERKLLSERTTNLERYASFTPLLIIFTAILSFLITILLFVRIIGDIEKRAALVNELKEKDIDITRRINIIENLANKISGGSYDVRVNDTGADNLGSLAYALNTMGESLQYSFNLLSDKEWQQTGLGRLSEKILGEKDIELLTNIILHFIAGYTGSEVGAFYLLSGVQELQLHGALGIEHRNLKRTVRVNEGLAGRCLAEEQELVVTGIDAADIIMSFTAVDIRPKSVIAFPTFIEGKLNGVIELGTTQDYPKNKIEFLKAAANMAGIAVNSALNRKKLQQLLEETQAQSEELQAQQNELEGLNTELEAQTESLQASEEELKVQQAELQQSNQDLEERSRLLEEKNQVIAERNLDIQRKAEQLEQTTRYKSEFLANMSHELRTPLNSILLLSRLLSENNEKNLNAEQVESAKVIQSSGNGLLSLIDEILDLSKIEAGKMEAEYSQVSIAELLDDMRALFAPVAREKGLELKLGMNANVPLSLETDKMRLEQILKNLLSNALKFTSSGSVVLQVGIEGPADLPVITFTVTDTGIGIPEQMQGLIFEAFRQADGSTKRKYGGTGLGLSISRELGKLLGGNIRLTSTPGKGSTFTLTLPGSRIAGPVPDTTGSAAGAEPVRASLRDEAHQKFLVPVIPDEIPDDRNNLKEGDKLVLIVEDDTGFAGSLLSFTRRSGYKGIVIVRGDQAVPFARQYKPVAVLLDIRLPVKDGWQIIEELKTDPKTRHIPVHIMSSLDARKESLQSGAVDFINKPLAVEQMQQVFARIEDALNRHPKKVLIVEENPKHAKALAYFLESFSINAEVNTTINESIRSLQKKETDCVILDMGVPDQSAYETLEMVKKKPGFENLPIIIFTGKNLSRTEESKLKKYADSIVIKTAHSYQRILDEVGMFLHLVEQNNKPAQTGADFRRLGALDQVLAGKKVLIADDDVRNIYSLSRSLEQHNMKVFSAIDGKEAVQVLAANPDINVVLMDMMMPEMDGYESIRKIRQVAAFKKLPILAVTAKAMIGDRKKCIDAGASDYISKPVDIDQLVSLLRVWLYEK